MNNYSDKSVFEINCAIAHIIFDVVEIIRTIGEDSIMVVYVGDDGNDHMTLFAVDYCNNPADSWRLMVDNKICINWNGDDSEWDATERSEDEGDCGRIRWHEKPGRAVAECFLMIKGGEV